jgi:hypothetical protein
VITERMARQCIPSMLQTPAVTRLVGEHSAKDDPHGAKGVG